MSIETEIVAINDPRATAELERALSWAPTGTVMVTEASRISRKASRFLRPHRDAEGNWFVRQFGKDRKLTVAHVAMMDGDVLLVQFDTILAAS